jgi:translation initiation factor IF-2
MIYFVCCILYIFPSDRIKWLFDVIYKLTEWLAEEMEKRRPRVETFEVSGRAKILKVFSQIKDRQIAGGKVTEGKMTLGSNIKILRRETEIGRGRITNLEKSKSKITEVEEGTEFGMMIESTTPNLKYI